MKPFFPKQIAYRAIFVYLLSLTIVSILYLDFAMKIGYFALGVAFVVGFLLYQVSGVKGGEIFQLLVL